MELKDYLTQHAWWGKLIGAGLGFLTAGPPGALLGVFVGNLFDRGLSEHFTRPHSAYHAEKRNDIRQTFQRAAFLMMGHMAKADGRVSEQEITFAKNVMRELHLNREERAKAQLFFTEGKKASFKPDESVMLLKSLASKNPRLLRAFIQLQYKMAEVDGLTQAKISVFNQLLTALDFAPFYQQRQAYESFHQQHTHWQNYQRQTQRDDAKPPIDEAYSLLNVSRTASQAEVKKAYRKLMSQHHPDKRIAEGQSEADIKAANEKTQAIRKAYEAICEQNGW